VAKPRRSPASDYQREEVYDWEKLFHSVKCNTADTAWFDKNLAVFCRRYKVKPPKVIKRMPKKWEHCAGVCYYKQGTIHFAKGYQSMLVMCHEMAHWVLDSYGYGDIGPHGPRFMGVYLWMLSAAHVMPLDVGKYSARKAGLKFRDPERECAPGQLKKYLKKNT
jgi:hypothetical protein